MMRRFALYTNRFLIIFFTLIIFIPAGGLIIKKDSNKFRTLFNRDPYPFPHIDIKNPGRTDFKAIESWFGDKALLLTSLSKLCSNLIYSLGASSKPGQAILGKNDWLFLGNDYSSTIDQLTGKNRPKPEEIYLQLAVLKQMKHVASQYHIPFIMVIAPDKHDIYPEYLPPNIQKGTFKNRLELLEEMMAANKIEFVSLRQKELEAKKTLAKHYGDLYLKGDSHWNYLGAYIAYQAIAERMTQHGIKINSTPYEFLPQKTYYSDLTNFLQLTHIKSNNPLPDTSKRKMDLIGKDVNNITKPMVAFEGNPDLLLKPYQNINKASEHKQSCLLIGDSFSESLSFYFYNDFYNTIRIHSGNTLWDLEDLINRYHPQIIVYEKIERDLINPLFNFQHTAAQVVLKAAKQRVLAKAQIDKFKVDSDKIVTNGWAYIPNKNAGLGEVYLKLTQGKESYIFIMNKILKQQISLAFQNDGNHLNLSGFSGVISRQNLPKGSYKISLVVRNKNTIGIKKFSQNFIN